jgi:hypothetical protein
MIVHAAQHRLSELPARVLASGEGAARPDPRAVLRAYQLLQIQMPM